MIYTRSQNKKNQSLNAHFFSSHTFKINDDRTLQIFNSVYLKKSIHVFIYL